MFTGKVMLIPDYIDEIDKLKQENQELKKQVDVLKHNEKQASDSCRQHRLASKNHIRRLKRREEQIMRLKNQQKEFIEYLENEIDICNDWDRYKILVINEILSKYKEIMNGTERN